MACSFSNKCGFTPLPLPPSTPPVVEDEVMDMALEAFYWDWEAVLSCEYPSEEECGEGSSFSEGPKCHASPQGALLPPGVTLEDLLANAWRARDR